MNFLLIVVLIIPIVFIGYLASRLDKFLENKGFAQEEDASIPVAVVLGDSEQAKQVVRYLEQNKIHVYPMTEPFLFDIKYHIDYLFALSDSDADNIVSCKVAKKVYGIDKVISLCNDRNNLNIFAAENIRCFSDRACTVQDIFRAAKGPGEVKI